MQPYSPEFARKNLTPQRSDITIDKMRYRADTSGATGYVVEKGPKGEKSYTIEQVLGGKNVYYFLTLLEKGRLQTLPIAYDVKKNEWFDTAASGLRHCDRSAGRRGPTRPTHLTRPAIRLPREPALHQLRPEDRHLSHGVGRSRHQLRDLPRPLGGAQQGLPEAPKGTVPQDLKIISVKKFTPEQHNATCSRCHAKMSPLTATVPAG